MLLSKKDTAINKFTCTHCINAVSIFYLPNKAAQKPLYYSTPQQPLYSTINT